MKFFILFFNSAPLHIAVEKNDIETINLLLSNKSIDINILQI